MAGCPYLRGFLYISGRHGMCNSADIATFSELYLTVYWQGRLTKGCTMSNTTNVIHRAKNEISYLSSGKKFDISFTDPVEDRAKCHTYPTFGSILYRIGGKQ